MDTIRKKIVTDEAMNPVAVQIDYKDWLEIERLLTCVQAHGNLEELLSKTKGIWQKGDGLSYQENIRKEWDRN
jgi:hypothetical protein